jgi:hypothetical protein
MSDFPAVGSALYAPPIYSTWSLCCPAYEATAAVSSAMASGTWPFASRAYYMSILVPQPVIAYELLWYNGTVANGTVDAGIFDSNLTLLVSSGPQTQAGTSTIQTHNIADTALKPGLYFLGHAHSNTTGTIFKTALSAHVARLSGCGWSAVSSGTLATGPTLSNGTASTLTAVGFNSRSLAV